MSDFLEGLDLRERPVRTNRPFRNRLRPLISILVVASVVYALFVGLLSSSVVLTDEPSLDERTRFVLLLLYPVGEVAYIAAALIGVFLGMAVGHATGALAASATMFVFGVLVGLAHGTILTILVYATSSLCRRIRARKLRL